MTRSSFIIVGGLLMTGLWPAILRAVPDRLIEATPHNALAAMYLDATARAGDKRTAAETLVSALSRSRGMGLFGELSDTSRVVFELLQCWPVIHRYPRAYVLHDVRLKKVTGRSNRLERLAMSLVLQVGSDTLPLQQLIQHFLRSYTNDETGRLEEVTIRGRQFHRLTDSSLPGWVVWEWGRVDDLFIVGLGTGSADRILQSLAEPNRSMLQEEWFSLGHSKTAGQGAELELYLDVASLQQRLGESARDRVYAAIHSLGLEESQRSIWTVGSAGATYSCYAFHRREGGNVLERLSDPALYQLNHKKLIPAGASGYAIFNVDAASVLRRLRACYLSVQRLEKRVELMEAWENLARAREVDFAQEVLSQLGDHIIIHNHPMHPLRLPLMGTMLIEIKGDSRRVRRALEEILDYCALRLDQAAARRNGPLVAPLLRRSSDGIWYLQYGIYGPAIAVTQGWLVISYSPEALRANLMPPESLRSSEEARVPAPLGQSHPGNAADEAKTQFDDEQTGDQNPPEQPGSDQAEEDQ